ncbi:12666_t:CDS:1, partial [Dentiscutata heterogama]
ALKSHTTRSAWARLFVGMKGIKSVKGSTISFSTYTAPKIHTHGPAKHKIKEGQLHHL